MLGHSSFLNLLLSSSALVGATTFTAAGAVAQDSTENTEDYGIEEVVVTAQKREEALSEVPLALAAFSGDFQRTQNLDDIKALVKFTPGFAGDTKDSFIDFLNIRGVSTNDFGVGGDPSIAIFKNNLFQGRNGVVVTSLFDVERAEVLRGPQGFLFGRNAIGGAINVHTVRPDFDGIHSYFNGGVGQRSIYEMEAGINVPLTDNLAIRAAGYYSNEDGYVDNIATAGDDDLIGAEKVAGRLSVLYAQENWDFTVIAEYEDRETDGSVYRPILDSELFPTLLDTFGPVIQPPEDPRDINSDASAGIFDRGDVFSLSTELNIDLDGVSIVGLTQYRDHRYNYAEDFDGLPVGVNDYSQQQEGSYFEGELRVLSDTDGPLSWYAGVSGYHEDIDALFTQRADENVQCLYYYYGQTCAEAFAAYDYGPFTTNPLGLVERNRIFGDYTGFAAYADFTYQISDTLDISAGLRYTYDEKDFAINVLDVDSDLGPFFIFGLTTDGPIRDSVSFDDFTPRFVLRYRPTDDLTFYASATRGFKAGGYASFGVDPINGVDDDSVALPGARPDVFDPESVWSFEVGSKSQLFDNRLSLDVVGYFYTYEDLQLVIPEAGGSRVDNVGQVEGYGIEASAQIMLHPRADLFLTATLQNTDIIDGNPLCSDCVGNRLPGQPNFIQSGVLRLNQPYQSGEFVSYIEWRGQSETFGGIDNITEARNDGYVDVTLRVGYESDNGWHITAYAENLFDEVYYDATNEGGGIQPHTFVGPSRPLTIGVRFGARFGE